MGDVFQHILPRIGFCEGQAERVAKLMEMPVTDVWSKGKYRKVVAARSLLCYWVVRELDMSMTSLTKRLGISATAVSQSVQRGAGVCEKEKYSLVENR